MTTSINTKELGNAIRRKREELDWSLQGVSDATGISKSTLSRIENGLGVPDTANVAALTKWLDMPIDRFLGADESPVVYYPHESTPEIVRAHLMNDKKLPKATAEALAELFDVAYRQFSPRKA
jgi:transcriptional regulator with XRE-family HTH domain